jgi:DMSO/TMAO reductase YedYZ molybdopterin-dependent catalytic subunit/thiosulfate reductase cytochrome b subunit
MTIASESGPKHDPLRAKLTPAPLDRIPDDWIPPRDAWLPRIRIGKHWYSILWAVPIAGVAVIIFIAICQWLRTVPTVEAFMLRYPGVPVQQPPVNSGFPAWVRVQHYLNMFFMYFVMRAGIQIFADHPRAYWNRNCTPDTEWLRISHPVPTYRLWTAKDDAVTLPGWLGIPGIRHTIGLARWWHFSVNLLWVINGVIFCILLFATDQWMRLVPLTWDVIPNAVTTAIKYGSLDFPPPEAWPRFNSLQQLTYFFTFFIVAPAQIITGLLQGPAFSNKLGWIGRTLNRQVARSIHILGFSWFVFFIIVHGVFVFATSLKANTNHMFYGVESPDWVGLPYFIVCMAVLVIVWLLATPMTIRHARKVQKTGRFLIGGLKQIAEFWDPTTEEREKDISPHHWPNHHSLPNSPEYNALLAGNFEGYRLRIGGLVENPVELSYADLKAMPKQSQITTHFCIQGWSGCGKWGGVPMRNILDIVKPKKEARYVAFYSYSTGDDGGIYYECHRMHNMHHRLTILAYELNDEPLRVLHGAPVRLRAENELGFKMVKWVQAIEFIKDFRELGAGQGGYNEDHEFYGYRMPI